MEALLEALSNLGAHGVQVDVGHGGEHGAVAQESAGVEALFEEVSTKVLFEVGAPSDGLFEVLHERGEGAEALSAAVESQGV